MRTTVLTTTREITIDYNICGASTPTSHSPGPGVRAKTRAPDGLLYNVIDASREYDVPL
jgi:hypothetical protein